MVFIFGKKMLDNLKYKVRENEVLFKKKKFRGRELSCAVYLYRMTGRRK